MRVKCSDLSETATPRRRAVGDPEDDPCAPLGDGAAEEAAPAGAEAAGGPSAGGGEGAPQAPSARARAIYFEELTRDTSGPKVVDPPPRGKASRIPIAREFG